MKIVVKGETFEWADFDEFRDHWLITEEERAEALGEDVWAALFSRFLRGGRRAARVLLFLLYVRRHPEQDYATFDFREGEWELDYGFTDDDLARLAALAGAGEEPDPTPADSVEAAGSAV